MTDLMSKGVLKASSKAICRGIDLDAPQVERYNNEARQLLGEAERDRMLAIHGDLYEPTQEMASPEWRNFDIAIISMALHHVKDPVDMLRRLKDRLRPGGTLIVVEFLGKKENEGGRQYDPENMIEVYGNQKIWPGFTTGNLQADLSKAGFEGFEVGVLEEPAHVPESASRGQFGGELYAFFAKTQVPPNAR